MPEALKTKLRRVRGNEALIKKCRASAGGQIILVCITYYALDQEMLSFWHLFTLSSIVFLNLLRVILSESKSKIFQSDMKWYVCYTAATLLTALGWSLLTVLILQEKGIEYGGSVLMLIITAGITAAAAAIGLNSDRLLIRSFLIVAILPTIIGMCFFGTSIAYAIALVMGVYLAFLFVQTELQLRMMAQVQQGGEQFQALVDATIESLIIHKNEEILQVNPAFERLFGVLGKDAVSFPISKFIVDLKSHLNDPDRKINSSMILKGKNRDGQEFPVEAIDKSILFRGESVQVLCVKDITLRKRAEVALVENTKQAEAVAAERERVARESIKLKSEFFATMSHEIRTPLNAIIGFADLLMDSPAPDQQKKYLKLLRDSGELLLNLVNEILDFSKIDAGKKELELTTFSLESVIKSQVDLLVGRAKQKDLTIQASIDPSLRGTFRGDSGLLAQVLLNLIGNAIKFTTKGNIDVRVTGASSTPGFIRFEVNDTGIGITEVMGQKIFKPFSQVESSMARKYGGTGLGLSICKKIVELMSGRIGFTSVVEKGTQFWFEVPLEVISLVLEQPGKINTIEPLADVTNISAKKILVAEDNTTNQMLILALLRRLGYQCSAVANGTQVLEALEAGSYDLVLMDCQMPELDGFETTLMIRQKEKQTGTRIPIIALTANVLIEDRERCQQCGMDGFIAKPVRRDNLVQVLSEHLLTRIAA